MALQVSPARPVAPESAQTAYAILAPFYDAYTRGYAHDTWLRRLAELASDHGLSGDRVLDAACGTGRSLAPLVTLGFRAAGCDLSPEMLARAAERVPAAPLHAADLRDLPALGVHDWVTCLDDALNYLLADGDLALALGSLARQLRPGGLLTFDLNSRVAHREGFDACWVVEEDEAFFCWTGRGCADAPGEPGHADLEIFARSDALWARTTSTHRQRWWGPDDVAAAAAAAGLEVLARYGQHPGAVIEPGGDEELHTKLVYVLRRGGGDA